MQIRERPRVLITGGSGFLGYNAAHSLRHNCEVYYTYNTNHPSIPSATGMPMDMGQTSQIMRVFDMSEPNVVIHMAAMCNAAECEKSWEKAYLLNTRSTNTMLELCGQSIKLILISTDYVRDGKAKYQYEEQDCFPRSLYGKSKYMAEQIVTEGFRRGHMVLRSALVYGWGKGQKHGFLDWMWKSLSAGQPVDLYEDEYRTPVYLRNFITSLRAAIDYKRGGLFNIAGSERLSRYEFGLRFCEVMGFDKALVRPLSLDSAPDAHIRLREGSLSNEKMRDQFAIQTTPMNRALEEIKKEILASANKG
jgi:dTDP-4-dehydrorhamnose reductase